MENAKVSNKKLMSLAILFVSALEMGGMGLQPALADIAAAFPRHSHCVDAGNVQLARLCNASRLRTVHAACD